MKALLYCVRAFVTNPTFRIVLPGWTLFGLCPSLVGIMLMESIRKQRTSCVQRMDQGRGGAFVSFLNIIELNVNNSVYLNFDLFFT